MSLISVIVPCYNEEESLPFFYREITRVSEEMRPHTLEYIFVDDGSRDRTMEVVRELAASDRRVKYVSFSRNFGKESAIYAGLKKARGDYAVLMDADLQDPPALLPEMLARIESGECDSVATRRVTRKGEPPVRSFFARCFYRLINKISKTEFVDGARDYRLMKRDMVDAVLQVSERNRFTKGIFSWVGFRTSWMEYENVERVAGETKWSFWKLFLYSIEGITAYSTVPLSIASVSGVLFCLLSFIMLLVVFFRALIWGDPVSGWPSTICILLLISGIQLFCMGILGQYLAKTYLETKNRPIYIAREESPDEDEDD